MGEYRAMKALLNEMSAGLSGAAGRAKMSWGSGCSCELRVAFLLTVCEKGESDIEVTHMLS